MRNITQHAKVAFENNCTFKCSNTKVITDENNTVRLFLHNNEIAKKLPSGEIHFSMCGWDSTTTKERLKAASVKIVQRKGTQFYMHPEGDLLEIDTSAKYSIDENDFINEVK